MTSAAAALGALNLAGVRLLCTIGSCAGLIVVLLGLRLNRKAHSSSQEAHSPITDARPVAQAPPVQSAAASQQIIRLTTNPGATRSSEMSQQQKIAAALDKAGIATSATWSNPAPSSEPATEQQTPAITPGQAPIQTHASSLIRRMFLLGGSMLALISLIVFLTIR
ncbi:MAG: hypothetical protein LAP86_08455 [Acidobacteriia bacterium]|nr:hypothetical protein [Terriglobia bacterium]